MGQEPGLEVEPMTLAFEKESAVKFPFDMEAVAREVIGAALDLVGCPYEAQVSLLVTDKETIRQMNRDFRGIDRETDVLSFPLQTFDRPGDFSSFEEDRIRADAFDPDSGELLLGDIAISDDRIVSQAEEYGHSQKREFAFLVAHSMLHLTGYDHTEEGDREVMEDLQRKIMDKVGILREAEG